MNNSKGVSFLRGLSVTVVGSIVANLVNFVVIMLIVKQTNQADFGRYIFILAIIHGLRILGGMGLDLTMVRFLSGADSIAQRNTFWHIIGTRLMVSLIFFTVLLFGGSWIFHYLQLEVSNFIPLIGILFLLTTFKELFYYVFQGLQLFNKYALVQVLFSIGKFLLVLGLIVQTTLNLSNLLWMEVGALLLTLVTIFFMLPYHQIKLINFDKTYFNKIIRFGLPLYLNNILTFIYSRIHIFILGALLNPMSVAFFEVAYKIPEGISRLFHSFITVFFPRLSEHFKNRQLDEAKELIDLSLLLLAAASAILFVFVYFFRFDIIQFFFTEAYKSAGDVFFLLMLNFYLIVISYTMGYSLVSAGYSSVPAMVNFVSSTISIIANYFLIKKWGYIGAAYAQILMNVVALIMNGAFLKKINLGIHWIRIHLPFILGLLFVLLAAWVNFEHILLRLLMFVFFFILCFSICTELRKITVAFIEKIILPRLGLNTK